jgi:hypothetical protein
MSLTSLQSSLSSPSNSIADYWALPFPPILLASSIFFPILLFILQRVLTSSSWSRGLSILPEKSRRSAPQ